MYFCRQKLTYWDMQKQILKKEYPLSAKSSKIVWDMISNAAGLQKWLADVVIENGEEMTFTWGHPWTERDTKVSRVLELEKYSHIKLKWDYQEDDPDAYWEMRIEQSELTGNLNLLITDYADPEDIEDLKGLWDANMERLHRVSGFLL